MEMTWYSACLLLLFLFRTNGKKEHLDENNFRHCYGNFFRKWHSESYLITAIFEVPSQKLRDIDSSILKDTLQFFILRTWINMRAKSFIKTSVSVTETRIDEGVWKKISCAKRALGRTSHQSRKHVSLILCASFSLNRSF